MVLKILIYKICAMKQNITKYIRPHFFRAKLQTWALPCNLKHFHTYRTIWLLKHILILYDIMSLRRDLKIQELNQATEIIYDQNVNVIVYVLIVYISQPIHPQGSSLSGHIIFTELFSLEIIQLGLPRLSFLVSTIA